MVKVKFTVLILLLSLFSMGDVRAAQGDAISEFTDSIQFDAGDSTFKLADLKGKAYLLMFFQSW